MSVATATQAGRGRPARATFPVVELFGPTVQGEGPEAGMPAYFVRFGGCDFRCAWCDSMHAVEPMRVRTAAEHLTTKEIVARIVALPDGPNLVVLSGGNPALLDLTDLVGRLHDHRFAVAVETQGSRWRTWLASVDQLVVSPKPPSSGMAGQKHMRDLQAFMSEVAKTRTGRTALKIVVFDAHDLDWAADRHREHTEMPLYLSAGTDLDLEEQETIDRLRVRYRWLCEAVAQRSDLAAARVLPQLHVIAWGTAKGV
jgi:7-carboxy-7-deazaguanine synthase